jgi:hypothetical protein
MLENYELLDNGVIKQKTIFNKMQYGLDYSTLRYDSYGELTNYMSYLRYGYLVGVIGRIPDSIVDVGYGNGSFLTVCNKVVEHCYGYDVSDYPVPDGCQKLSNLNSFYDVITFFDSLEHFDDISFVKDLNCNFICISVPECHYFSDDWFSSWKHRRPDEHLWHFNKQSLIEFMLECGFENVSSVNIEDNIRKHGFDYSNILTCVFKKK